MANTKVDNPYNINSLKDDYESSSDIEKITPNFIFTTYNTYGTYKNDLGPLHQSINYSNENGLSLNIISGIYSNEDTPSTIPIRSENLIKLFYNPEKYTSKEDVKKSTFICNIKEFPLYPPAHVNILGTIEETGDSFMSSLINIEEDTSLDIFPQGSKICSNITNKMYIIDDKIYIPYIDSYFHNLDFTDEGKYLKFPNNQIITNEQVNCFLEKEVVTDSKNRSWNHDIIYNIPLLDISDFPGYEFYKNKLGIYLILYFPSSVTQNETTYGLPLYLDDIDNIAIAPELNEEKYIDNHYGRLLNTSIAYFGRDLVIKIPTGATKFYMYSDFDSTDKRIIENWGDQRYLIIGTNYDNLITSTLAPELSNMSVKGIYEKISNTNIPDVVLLHEGNSNTIRYHIKFE